MAAIADNSTLGQVGLSCVNDTVSWSIPLNQQRPFGHPPPMRCWRYGRLVIRHLAAFFPACLTTFPR